MKETPTEETPTAQTEPKDAPEAVMPQEPDPLLVRRQQLQQQLQHTNKQIMEARQQEALIKDMITSYTLEAAEVRGALRENTIQQQKG